LESDPVRTDGKYLSKLRTLDLRHRTCQGLRTAGFDLRFPRQVAILDYGAHLLYRREYASLYTPDTLTACQFRVCIANHDTGVRAVITGGRETCADGRNVQGKARGHSNEVSGGVHDNLSFRLMRTDL